MAVSSRYWNIWCLSAASETLGYESRSISVAQEFAQKYIPSAQEVAVQLALLAYFRGKNAAVTARMQAEAGLCLRCYVSTSILKACHTIDHLFGSDKSFTYRDLLPFVLNDDGKTLVILDHDRKTQQVVIGDNPLQPSTYQFFAVDVLRTFKFEAQASLSLDNWTFLRTKQNAELKQFLAEFGFQHLSDWALLNRARPHQLERLSERDCHLVDVFHAVYRRDRRQQRTGSKRCPDPTTGQLQEMMADLQAKGVAIATASALLSALKIVATQLRQYDIWSHRVPLEVSDPDTGRDDIRSDLPSTDVEEFDLEQQELLMFFHQQLDLALNVAIIQELRDRVAALERSKKYASLASQFIPGLRLYYNQGLSLKEIAPRLGMSSWDQARRVLNPGDLLSKVRARTVQQVLDRLLAQAQQRGFASTPPEPNYLRTLAEQVEAIADQEIFQAAVEEMRAGQSRSFNSIYAQQLRVHLNDGQRDAIP
ncbi:MAG: hypothetical protein NW220_11395 [Leptolyngbyaceae cyanobacterium bins.349]|nr:hypothetical protein [Leptolyngbyaceae cyanobacterium bins.349]